MTAGSTYTFSMYWAQRYIDPNLAPGYSNSTLAITVVVSLDTLVVETLQAGMALTEGWETLSKTFVWPGPDMYPLFSLTAIGPTGSEGQGVDVTVVFDALKIDLGTS